MDLSQLPAVMAFLLDRRVLERRGFGVPANCPHTHAEDANKWSNSRIRDLSDESGSERR